MKCVKKNNEVRRVPDLTAYEMVKKDGWTLCMKREWKEYLGQQQRADKPEVDHKENEAAEQKPPSDHKTEKKRRWKSHKSRKEEEPAK